MYCNPDPSALPGIRFPNHDGLADGFPTMPSMVVAAPGNFTTGQPEPPVQLLVSPPPGMLPTSQIPFQFWYTVTSSC
jgi:hypothetical protein